MKPSIFSFILILAFNFSLSAQTTATWKGGKPGRATDWNCHANWSEGRVPDEFTKVIILTGKHYYPVIEDDATPIDALLIEGGATLTIKDKANLTILGETGRLEGIIVFGQIENNGMLEIGENVNLDINILTRVHGNGIIIKASERRDAVAMQR
jgi:hypothetical protein